MATLSSISAFDKHSPAKNVAQPPSAVFIKKNTAGGGCATLISIAIAALFFSPSPSYAHHILGIPHYAYDEDYPQTPVLTYSVEAGPHELKMTANPGRPEPGEKCSIHLYITRIDNGAPFEEPVTLTVTRNTLMGEDTVVYGPMEAHLEEAMFKFYPLFEDEANYTVRIAFEAEGAPWIIDLPMVAGEPGSPWALLAGIAGALGAFLIVIRALRIKMARRAKTQPAPAS